VGAAQVRRGGKVRPIWKQEGLNMNTPEKAEIRELAASELDQVNGGVLPLLAVAAVGFSLGFTGATIGYKTAMAIMNS
jgi:lactobin A/cerein 7B family class IIb bacteriocin